MRKKNSDLALLGGPKEIKSSFSGYNPIGHEEITAVNDVMKTGILSKYVGASHEDFLGGPKVKEFEKSVCEYFSCQHAISVNSWTSGLIAAIGAIDLQPGDEVLVSPWTMCASATAIVHWNAIPIFVDIEPDTFCIDPSKLEAQITEHTRAIMAVDIFGQSADIDKIMALAKKHKLHVISDTAQSPGALYKGKLAGTLTDIGGYSLNYHKHIHTGEGGLLVTNNRNLATRMQLIRNHAEAVVRDMKVETLSNMIGYNFRLGEIESAIGIEQLKKLKDAISSRQKIADRLTDAFKGFDGISTPVVRSECTHSYYFYAMKLDDQIFGVSKSTIYEALMAEGCIGLLQKYENLHLLPMYQKKIAFGKNGYPWVGAARRKIDYRKGICPVAEELNESSFLGLFMCASNFNYKEVDSLINAFHKVFKNIDCLRAYERQKIA